MKQHHTTFNKAMGSIHASIVRVCGMTKPQQKFLQCIFNVWAMLPMRHNFLNRFCYGDGRYSEKTIRHQFSRKINFMGRFDSAFYRLENKECIVAIDPSYISKSGKKTCRKGRFWSGKDQRAEPGLETGCLTLIDATDETAYNMEAVQTPPDRKEKLMDHYVGFIKRRADRILKYTSYLIVDGYFHTYAYIERIKFIFIITELVNSLSYYYSEASL